MQAAAQGSPALQEGWKGPKAAAQGSPALQEGWKGSQGSVAPGWLGSAALSWEGGALLCLLSLQHCIFVNQPVEKSPESLHSRYSVG